MNRKIKQKMAQKLYYKRDLESRVVTMKKGIDEVNSMVNSMNVGKKKKKRR